jgi:hypothetical protein
LNFDSGVMRRIFVPYSKSYYGFLMFDVRIYGPLLAAFYMFAVALNSVHALP